MEIMTFLAPLGAGITYALIAYAKKQEQVFDALKFGGTIGIGILAGITSLIWGYNIEASMLFVINLGAIPLVENVLKLVYRKVKLFLNKK